MRNYELTVIIRQGKTEEGKTSAKDTLAKHGVKIQSEEDWGNRKLAYMIDEQKEGYYMFSIVEADPAAIKKIEADFRLNKNILRHMFVVIEKKQSA